MDYIASSDKCLTFHYRISHTLFQLSLPKDVVEAAPTGDAPATSEWSTILLSTKMQLILEVWRYIQISNF